MHQKPTPEPYWEQSYRRKITTADEAVKVISSGHRVAVHPGCATPAVLVRAMCARWQELRGVEIVHIMSMGEAPYMAKELSASFRHNAFFIGSNVREAVNEGRADFTPIFLSEIEALFESGQMPIDVALIHVSPPDEHGFCSFGVGVEVTKTAAMKAEYVIAQVNPQMPRALGDSFIHVSNVTYFVPVDTPILELPRVRMGEEHAQIGQNVAELIRDGDTLQMGIGAIPDAVLAFLKDRRDLGVHTEMFSDGIVELVEAGIITGAKKTLHPGKMVASFVLGSRRLYDFLNNNPLVELHPSYYVNDPFVIAQNRNMVAINSALQVDLTGQVVADSIGHTFYSGIGGQVDFIRGSARSKGGRPIIALLSTAKNGEISRIVSEIDPGAGVVTSRGDVHYVVTEYGVAYLHGKTIRERAKALINIAHPAFREDLTRQARELHYL